MKVSMQDREPSTSRSRPMVVRLLPVILLAAGFAAAYTFDLGRYFSIDALRDHREALAAFVSDHALLSYAAFAVVYAVTVAFSIPGAAVLTVAGGFLFGTVTASILVIFGATAGATAIFLAARTALSGFLRHKAGKWITRIGRGFHDNAVGYLLFLRLVPAFPFFAVNIAPAFLSVRTWTYVWTTFVGIIPGTVVYAAVGAGLGKVFDRGETPDLAGILSPEIILALTGLAILALLPGLFARLRKRREDAGERK